MRTAASPWSPHPFSHGGWSDWGAPFDGLEVHNNASAFRALGLRLPTTVLFALFDRSYEEFADASADAWERCLSFIRTNAAS